MTDSLVLPVFYATDRQPVMPLDKWQAKLPRKGSQWAFYGTEYDPTHLELGVCPVSVPTATHRVGQVERPGWLSASEDPGRHFGITGLKPLLPESFFAELNHRLAHSTRREVFVFIHGYNMTFSSAMLYTSQLAWDWSFPGVPLLYSWPSEGALLGYPRDEESIRLTEAHLRAFLEDLRTRSAATNISLIAHSIGNRALLEVLKSFAAETNQPVFNQVILAAPDVNRVGFLQEVAVVLPKVARRVTLYASSADRALQASQSFHQFPRAGDVGPEPLVCQGIDTIDASAVPTDLLGHSYMLRAGVVIADMADVLCRNLPPQQRHLTPVLRNGHQYWKLGVAPGRQ